ncbi:MAG: iron uptake porin [Pelatocladus maniniholoensis HA4357-MV3]|uniref:Iron uptake porin n=1 Tax=Pelatocladus maniniholoensis HA4357-MV3 TaxID=1117104 RepID=A0A9E3HCF8_9NOST|nr:iron uptake porin [Pelatocladus maniniholoensis HA4357-MV3]BAZ68689.1 S-layer domain-containing protein [Fischerella sp. NIES-4106]
MSVKQCRQWRIHSPKILAGGLVGWGFFTHTCLPSRADSLLIQQPPETQNPDLSLQAAMPEVNTPTNKKVEVLPPDIDTSAWQTEFSAIANSELSVQNESFNSPDLNSDLLTQQTSVSELSDVKPTDWAYQALVSLMEKYGVISGYADGTFGGNRPLSRYEFAVALATTLSKVEDIIANSMSDRFIQEDMVVLRRLQKEFRSALDDLNQRVDGLEARNSELQAHQFSTTTKLHGEAIIALSDGTDANKTVISRTRLTLSTSFNQQDLLLTQLEAGNNGGDAIGLAQKDDDNLLGTTGLIADGGGLDYVEVDSDLKLRRLHYSFRPSEDVAVTVGAKMSPRDFIDHNKYANNEAVDFSSSFFLNNPLIVQNQIDRNGGAGAAVQWSPGDGEFTLRSLYIAADADQANSTSTEGGLFGDRYQASVEVEYSPSDKLALRLQYTNALINNTDINAFGVNAEYSLNRNAGIFGRFGFGNYNGYNTAIDEDLDLHPVTWAIGVGFRNLLLPGTVAGVAIGQPFVSEDLGNATQTNYEAFYNLQLSDNLSITPIFSLVTNADNDSSNGTIWQTTLRSVFSF